MPPATDSLLNAFQELTDPRDRVESDILSPGYLLSSSWDCSVGNPTSLPSHDGPSGTGAYSSPHSGSRGRTRLTRPPTARTAARFSVDQFRTALARWLSRMIAAPVTAAVDGKTSKQAGGNDGEPIHVLNVFAHQACVCLADWPVGEGKDTEPEVLKAHIDELFTIWPSLRIPHGRCHLLPASAGSGHR